EMIFGADLDVQPLRHDVHSLMGSAFAGYNAHLAAAIAVEDRTAEDAFDQRALVSLQHLGGCDDRIRPPGTQAALLEILRDEKGRTGVSLDDARTIAEQFGVKFGE